MNIQGGVSRFPPYDTSILSITSTQLDPKCQQVSEYMRQSGIPCEVTPNQTVVENGCAYTVENGCHIKLVQHSPYLVNPLWWSKLQKRFGLDCAHLEVVGKYKGCIYDYFRVSSCPGRGPNP